MSFQIKDFLSIVASMVNHMRATQDKVTDFNVGSVARTMIEAPAIEIDELYQMMFRGLKEAIPVSVFQSFDFGTLPPIGASGAIRFSIPTAVIEDVTIPSGVYVMRTGGGGYRYFTTMNGVIPAGSTSVDVAAYCESAGAATNVPANTLTVVSGVSGVSATNPAMFANGRDAESEVERKARFMDYISTIARGTNAALLYGASTVIRRDAAGLPIERAAMVSIHEPYLTDSANYPPALVWMFVHNGGGGTSAELVADVQRVINGYVDQDGTIVPGWKAAGVSVVVSSAADTQVDVGASVVVLDGYTGADVRAQVDAGVRAYLSGLGIGEKVVVAEIVAAAMIVDGVYNVSVTLPAADIVMGVGDKAIPGTVEII